VTSAGSRLLGGRYELGELLGYGGMAEVYLGRDVRLSRQVAVKVLRPDLARDPAFLARFRREAQSAASLSHPSIVSVYDTGEDQGSNPPTPYIVMEYVQGPTLRDVLRSEGPMAPRRAAEITAEVCRALDYAHSQGLVHRDVKPGNVMLDRRNQVKVMDFGIARAATASSVTMTQTAAVIGTAQYLSPEQARGEHTDGRSDVYSAGCLLYELLTGRPPFTGDSPVAVAYQHVRENPIPPSQVDAELPRDFDVVVLKAMAKAPENRYATAGAMAHDLDLLAAGRRVTTQAVAPEPETRTTVMASTSATTVIPRGGPAPSALPLERPNRRNAYIALGVLVVLLLAGAAAVAAHLTGGSSAPKSVAFTDQTGKTKQYAEDYFKALGLKVSETDAFSVSTPANNIITQKPASGTLTVGSTVALTVSKGADDVEVPDVTGFTQQSARQAINGAGLKNTDAKEQVDVKVPKGTVLSTDPKAGTKVARNSAVVITIASGNTTVPDLTKMTQAEAFNALQAAGLTIGDSTKTQVVTDPTLVGTVVSQSPAPKATAARNSPVNIVLGMLAPTTAPPTPSAVVTTPVAPPDTTVPTTAPVVPPDTSVPTITASPTP
jgi:serine/threonine protein kinase